MKKERRIINSVLIIFGIILFLSGLWWYRQARFLQRLDVQKNEVPTLFIPGYRGNRLSFGGMIFRLDHYGLGTKAMVVRVSTKGKVKFEQRRSLKTKNPLIQVLFANNRDERLEAVQLGKVLTMLKQKYQVKQVNLVGHSSGGNIAFNYLTNTSAKKSQAPQVMKFVNIATTFPGKEKDGKKLDPQLSILNIAGNIWNFRTDGGIPLDRDMALKKIVKPYIKSYQAKIISGSPLTTYHSMLHENGEVDRAVAVFLFKNGDQVPR